MKLTHEQFIERLYQRHKNNIICLEQYINMKTKIKFKCNICNYIWNITPNTILHHNCPNCNILKQSQDRIWTHEKFIIQLYKRYKNKYYPLELYKGSEQKIKFQCNEGHIFYSEPCELLSGKTKCLICSKNEHRHKYEQKFLQKLYQIHKNNIIPLSNYIKAEQKIKCKCNICNYIWNASPHNLMQGTGCPNCKLSRGERIIKQFLINNNFIFIPQFKIKLCKDKKLLPFDFAIFKTEQDKINKIPWTLIEYDGQQHIYPHNFGSRHKKAIDCLQYIQKHDNIKNQFCKDNNINLIRINDQNNLIYLEKEKE